jgi:hypothetical protein
MRPVAIRWPHIFHCVALLWSDRHEVWIVADLTWIVRLATGG